MNLKYCHLSAINFPITIGSVVYHTSFSDSIKKKKYCVHMSLFSSTQVNESLASYFGMCCMAWKPGNNSCWCDFYFK